MLPSIFLALITFTFMSNAMDIFAFPNRMQFQQEGPKKDRAGPTVETTAGAIQGIFYTSTKRVKAELFLGVPYAEPPIDDLRFHDPVPKNKWSGVLETKSYKAACWQNSTTSSYHPDWRSEDCLYLNIFKPPTAEDTSKLGSDELFPVLYYIHGGGWEYDSPRQFPIEDIVNNFVSRGVLVVMVGYRLGIQGFFSTETPEYSGNYAYKDIILGLKWVQGNIERFQGNPRQVTIMGDSSGATTVAHLAMSPKARGLFNQGIEMSGLGSSSGTFNNDPARFRGAAEFLGCKGWDEGQFDEVVQCLRKVPAQELSNAYLHYGDGQEIFTRPRIDGKGGLFPAAPSVMRQSLSPVTMMLGTAGNEFPLYSKNDPPPTPDEIDAQCKMVSATLGQSEIGSSCSYFYNQDLKRKLPESEHKQALKQVINDAAIFAPTFADVDSVRANGQPAFLYSFDYSKKEIPMTPMHAFELTFLFGLHRFVFNDQDYEIQKVICDLFTSFMKSGVPKSASDKKPWQPVRAPTGFNYYSINLEPVNKEFYHFYQVQFWNTIVPYLQRFSNSSGKISSVQPMKLSSSIDETTRNMLNMALLRSNLNEKQQTNSKKLFNSAQKISVKNEPLLINLAQIDPENSPVVQPQKLASKTVHITTFSIIGWTVFAISLYGFLAVTISYVACIRKSQQIVAPISDQAPLLIAQPTYSTFYREDERMPLLREQDE